MFASTAFTYTRQRLAWLAFTVACTCLPLIATAQAQPAASAQQTAHEPEVVNINSASAEELERLPGIGPTRARAILELRGRITHFSRLEELLRVKGIGRATFRKLRPWLTLTGPTTLHSR